MDEGALARLVGHPFPGGRYLVAHWENWLLTDCAGRAPMADDLVHPIVLFHAPILGAGTSIAELFRLGQASCAGGSVGLLGYDWEYLEPIREDLDYQVEGAIISAERSTSASGAVDDHVAFRIELSLGGTPVARVTNRWRFRRRAPSNTNRAVTSPTRPSVAASELPVWAMTSVDPARMKTMAALLRDPYPVHWDRLANERSGLGARVLNQGPLNLAYIANMLMAWAGDAAIRRLTVTFGRPVLDGDHVIAGGRVTGVSNGIAHCEVWLALGDETVVSGTADVVAP